MSDRLPEAWYRESAGCSDACQLAKQWAPDHLSFRVYHWRGEWNPEHATVITSVDVQADWHSRLVTSMIHDHERWYHERLQTA